MRLFSRKPESQRDYKRLDKPQVKKSTFIVHTLVFAVLELGFLILAYCCLIKPIPIHPPSSVSSTETKAIITILAVIWHTLAAFAVKDIVLCVFGAECMEQYHRTGRLEPEKTDVVSRITTGLLVQTSYFLTTQPTTEYRLAFILALLLTGLGPLGPSIISSGSSLQAQNQEMRIANLTMARTIMSFSQRPAFNRAALITQMELVEGKPYGYATENERLLVPWPEPSFQTRPEVYTYETDVVVYDYSCRWNNFSVSYEEPTHPNFGLEGVQIEGTDSGLWSPWTTGILYPSKSITPLVYPPSNQIVQEFVSLSAFVFITNNNSDSDGTEVGAIDLVGTGASGPFQGQSTSVSVASILLCDPQFQIKRAQVTLSQGHLNATVLHNASLIGNIPESAAAAIFSQGLLDTLSRPDFDAYGVGTVAGLTFLENDTSDIFPNVTTQPRPFPLAEINRRMNRVIQSAAKAYISGYSTKGAGEGPDGLNPIFFWINQTASVQYQQTSLVSSAPFFIALGVLDIVIAITLLILVRRVNTTSMQLFSLHTLENVYRKESV